MRRRGLRYLVLVAVIVAAWLWLFRGQQQAIDAAIGAVPVVVEHQVA